MKKEYKMPVVSIEVINAVHMICVSGPNTDDTTPADPEGGMDSKRRDNGGWDEGGLW